MFIEEITKIDTLTFAPQVDLKRAKYEKIEIFEDGWQNIVLHSFNEDSFDLPSMEIDEYEKRYKDVTTIR